MSAGRASPRALLLLACGLCSTVFARVAGAQAQTATTCTPRDRAQAGEAVARWGTRPPRDAALVERAVRCLAEACRDEVLDACEAAAPLIDYASATVYDADTGQARAGGDTSGAFREAFMVHFASALHARVRAAEHNPEAIAALLATYSDDAQVAAARLAHEPAATLLSSALRFARRWPASRADEPALRARVASEPTIELALHYRQRFAGDTNAAVASAREGALEGLCMRPTEDQLLAQQAALDGADPTLLRVCALRRPVEQSGRLLRHLLADPRVREPEPLRSRLLDAERAAIAAVPTVAALRARVGESVAFERELRPDVLGALRRLAEAELDASRAFARERSSIAAFTELDAELARGARDRAQALAQRELTARAEAAQRELTERAEAALRARREQCVARCRQDADRCVALDPAQTAVRCLPAFQACQQRCDR